MLREGEILPCERKPKKRAAKELTEVELEMMGVLWDLGEGTVSDVLSRLPSDRKLAYTSVSTMLRILEQKGVVSRARPGEAISIVPVLDKESLRKGFRGRPR